MMSTGKYPQMMSSRLSQLRLVNLAWARNHRQVWKRSTCSRQMESKKWHALLTCIMELLVPVFLVYDPYMQLKVRVSWPLQLQFGPFIFSTCLSQLCTTQKPLRSKMCSTYCSISHSLYWILWVLLFSNHDQVSTPCTSWFPRIQGV